MITINDTLPVTIDRKLLSVISPDTDKICFFDIETTGFSREYNICYLIGAVYTKNGKTFYNQWLAESDSDEASILSAFNEFVKDYDYIIHFNGDSFDIPFITERAARLGTALDLSHMTNLDLYKIAKNCKPLLCLTDYKQKTIEHFLGIHREDMYSGGELIEVYKEFSRLNASAKKDEYKIILLLHNHDDIEGMTRLLPLISYYALIQNAYDYESSTIENVVTADRKPERSLMISCALPVSVPVDRHICTEDIHLMLINNRLILSIPVNTCEMKYFYKDYRNYYYLPSEDEAIHKSIAQYVDSSNRVKCTAANCYTRKTGAFVPEFGGTNTPVFKKSFSDSLSYICLDDTFLSDPDQSRLYCQSVIKHILNK